MMRGGEDVGRGIVGPAFLCRKDKKQPPGDPEAAG